MSAYVIAFVLGLSFLFILLSFEPILINLLGADLVNSLAPIEEENDTKIQP